MKNKNLTQLTNSYFLSKGINLEDEAYSNMVASIMAMKQSHYGCYDMSLFVILYKYAKTQSLRDYAIKNMTNILDGYLPDDEILDEFKNLFDLFKEDEFYKIDEFKESQIDDVILSYLDYFEKKFNLKKNVLSHCKKELDYSLFMAGAGQADFIPEVPVDVAQNDVENAEKQLIASKRILLEVMSYVKDSMKNTTRSFQKTQVLSEMIES